MKKIIFSGLMLMMLSACGATSGSNISSMYSGGETGTWYQTGASCVAGICPTN